MVDFTFESVIGYIGQICLLILAIWQYIEYRKKRKENRVIYLPKDKWFQKTYIWQVFFRRAFYRPVASSFPYVLFILPSFIMMFWNYSLWSDGYPLKLEEMKKTSGIVTKVHQGRGKNSYDYIWVKDDKDHEDEYRVYSFLNHEDAEFKQKVQDTKAKVTVWYEEREGVFVDYKVAWQLTVNDKPVSLGNKIHFVYNYERVLKHYKSALPNLILWIQYALVGWFWIWWLNKKELPIHRLNRMKYYKKHNIKDE